MKARKPRQKSVAIISSRSDEVSNWGGITNGERRASGQDGGIGRHTAPPCTTKRRTKTI